LLLRLNNMESNIISQKKNPFLSRDEIVIEFKSETNPTYDEVKKAVGKDEGLIVVNRINANFGKHSFNANVFVYDSVEAKEKVETVPQKVRKKLEAEKKTAEETAKKAEEEAKKAEEEAKKAEEEAKAAPAESAPAETPATESSKNDSVEPKTESSKDDSVEPEATAAPTEEAK
jgi:ribosomal protein S24E